MMKHQIWLRQDDGTAYFLAELEGDTFEAACDKMSSPLSKFKDHYNPETRRYYGNELFPSRAEANGYVRSRTFDYHGRELVLMVGDEVLLRLPIRTGPGVTVAFPSAEFLASRLREMVDKMNFERCDR